MTVHDHANTHFAMLNDTTRNEAYKKAINSIDFKNKIVIDIGAGTGILSMMAVANGAKHVYAFECNKQIAHNARQIISNNGYQDKITLIDRKSSEYQYPLGEKADILITEIMDCGLVGEGILESICHAKAHLLKSDAVILPKQAKVLTSLVSSNELHQLNHINTIEKWDLSPFNIFSTKGHFPVRLNIWNYLFASNVETLFSFNFQKQLSNKHITRCRFISRITGEIHGIIFWFQVALTDTIYLENNPENVSSHWMQAFISFEEPIIASQGQTLEFDIEYKNYTYEVKQVVEKSGKYHATQL
ncbi:50S ribosomal protein L11 methyltransferase [Cysteiniphilum litorale]|uniref:50S ribosomal protein L11 methyltransferase n=1 Tax=Cysteiniphilum litorale TaxID=2056700 RepID=UPI003F881186